MNEESKLLCEKPKILEALRGKELCNRQDMIREIKLCYILRFWKKNLPQKDSFEDRE